MPSIGLVICEIGFEIKECEVKKHPYGKNQWPRAKY